MMAGSLPPTTGFGDSSHVTATAAGLVDRGGRFLATMTSTSKHGRPPMMTYSNGHPPATGFGSGLWTTYGLIYWDEVLI